MAWLFWYGAVSILCILMAIARLLHVETSQADRAFSASVFCFGLSLGNLALLLSGALVPHPHFVGVAVPFAMATGPMLYYYVKLALQLESAGPPWRWFLATVLLTAAAHIPLYIQPASMKVALMYGRSEAAWLGQYLFGCALMMEIINVGITFAILRLLHRAAMDEAPAERRVRRLALGMGYYTVSCTGLILLGHLVDHRGWRLLCIGLLSLLPIMFFLAQARYPIFIPLLRTSIQKARYETRRVGTDAVAALCQRLELAVSQHYAEDNLTLADLAKHIGISAHELSELLNLHLGISFNRYLNRARVHHAQKLLLAKPSMPVLDVGFAVGFGSKTVFNESFREETEMTPSAYRKENLKRRTSPQHDT